jgi:hypothetical protein
VVVYSGKNRLIESSINSPESCVDISIFGAEGVESLWWSSGEGWKGITLELTPNLPWPDVHHINLLIDLKDYLIEKWKCITSWEA